MVTVSGLFDKRGQARNAIVALEEAGIPRENVSVISSAAEAEEEHDTNGAIVGALVGGAGGLLAGLASIAILGVGPAVGAGWLVTSIASAAIGSATGGLIASMVDAGIDKDDAHIFVEGLQRGGTLLSARVTERELASVKAILADNNSVDITLRRKEYKLSGWEGFNEQRLSNADLAGEQTGDARHPAPD